MQRELKDVHVSWPESQNYNLDIKYESFGYVVTLKSLSSNNKSKLHKGI
jgi:hypothetical protein